jgi:hypothetical protein
MVMPNPGFKAQLQLLGSLGCDFSRWPGWEKHVPPTSTASKTSAAVRLCCGAVGL